MFLQNNCLIIYLLQGPSLICASLHFGGNCSLSIRKCKQTAIPRMHCIKLCLVGKCLWLKTDNDRKSLLIRVRSGQVSLYQYIQNVLIFQNISQYDQQRLDQRPACWQIIEIVIESMQRLGLNALHQFITFHCTVTNAHMLQPSQTPEA